MRVYVTYKDGVIRIRAGYIRYVYHYRFEDIERFKGSLHYFLSQIRGYNYKVVSKVREKKGYYVALLFLGKRDKRGFRIEGYRDIEYIG